jgi:hypothetical protein
MENANVLKARAKLNGCKVAVEADLIKVEQTDDFTPPKASWV